MATSEWESYVLCSRLKTKRQKSRLRIKDSDKHLLGLNKQLKRIRDTEHQLGYRELDPPVQRGWKRSFVMRYDVAQSNDNAFFQSLLDKINTTQFSHRKDFKNKKRRKGKKVHIGRPQKLDEPFEHAFERLKLTEKQKLYFKEEWTFTGKRDVIKRHVFTEPWRYVLKTEPNMITKIKVIDPLLLQQKAEIMNYLQRNDLQPKLDKLLYGYHQYRWNFDPQPKYKHILKPRSAKQSNGRQHNDIT